MTRRQDHNRNRNHLGDLGHSCSNALPGTGHTAGRDGAIAPGPDLFAVPALNIETTSREDGLWVHVRGEADLGNHEVLQIGLTRVELDGANAVHLGLSDLTFCDLSAFRHLVTFAIRVRGAGRDLSAHGACPTIRKVARLLDVSQELHFV